MMAAAAGSICFMNLFNSSAATLAIACCVCCGALPPGRARSVGDSLWHSMTIDFRPGMCERMPESMYGRTRR